LFLTLKMGIIKKTLSYTSRYDKLSTVNSCIEVAYEA